jgi:seryl-tRNA synthetase
VIDVKVLRADPDAARAGCTRKGADPELVDRLLAADEQRRALQQRTDDLRARQKAAGARIAKAAPDERATLVAESTALKAELRTLEDEFDAVKVDFDELLAVFPNLPLESVPPGATDEDNVVVATVGDAVVPDSLRDHHDIGTALGIVDLERGARTSGSRFAYLLGDAVRIQYALERLAMDTLTAKGFVPVVPPVLVREDAMHGTGFFPTDRAQVYGTDRDDDLFLVGTSEVPLAALHTDEIIDAERLPLRYVGRSTCFRREAGTYGKDTRGIFRVHQFDKIEMFSFCAPERSVDEHEFLLACEREIFDQLGLAYRVVNVCGGDLGTPAAKKYDIEAWLPSEGRYRELTSTSNTTDYQARRLKVRVRDADGTRVLHTLNGTAVAIGRALTVLLEQCQRPDGSVVLPDSLVGRGAPATLGPV